MDVEKILRDEFMTHPQLVPLLVEAGLASRPVIEATLNPRLEYLVPPDTLPDIKPAAEKILRHLKRGNRIVIWGHEDADGFTSTAVLLRTLTVMGARPGQVDYVIPSKKKDGHGLSGEILREWAGKVDLIITVDCGTSNVEEVRLARELGIDVVITDHHEVPEELPDTEVVNPKLGGENYPYLAGVGVALKVAWYLLRLDQRMGILQIAQELPELFVYAALGTLADRVPLVSENLILVQTGQETLNTRSFAFSRAFQRRAGHLPDLHVLIPLISSGFSEEDRHSLAVALLLAQDDEEADRLLGVLWERVEIWNRNAQRALEEALSRLGRVRRYVYVDLPDVEPHYLGYVASRLKDQFQLPTIVTGRKADSRVVGEVRYPYGQDSLVMLRELSHLFLSWGGHKLASGFSLDLRDLPEFIEELEYFFSRNEQETTLPVDLEIPEVDRELLRDVVRWGKHNVELRLRVGQVALGDLLQLNFEGIPVADPDGLLRLYPPSTTVEVVLKGGPEGLTVLSVTPLVEENKEVPRGYSGRSTSV